MSDEQAGVGPVDGSVRPVAWVSIDGLKDLHGCNAMAVWCGNPAIYDDQTAGPEKLAPVYGRGTVDRLTSERHDLALLVGRLIRRMRAARTGEGIAAGDDALEQQCIGYLRRKGLVSPLRDETAAMPPACTTPTGCREHGCHGECLPPNAGVQR